MAFDVAGNYPVGVNPQEVLTADFNNDGRLDVATANTNSASISVLLGNPNGTFQSAKETLTGPQPTSIAVGDFNADGKLDLASNSYYDVKVLLGKGDGTFQTPTNFAIGASTDSVAVGDFNGDGKLDLGVTSNRYYPGSYSYYGGYPAGYVGRANVLLGNGAGSFSAPIVTVPFGGLYSKLSSTALADFNADGMLDFATVNTDYFTAEVLWGAGDGTFGLPSSFNVGARPNAAIAGDLNGDGKADLVVEFLVNGLALNSVGVLLGDGLGAFDPIQSYSAGSQAQSVAMGDINGDGTTDLLTGNPEAGGVSALLGSGDGTFAPPLQIATGDFPFEAALGDFNGDGRIDAVAGNSNTNNVSVLINDGDWPALDQPSISINSLEVTEGNTGTTSADFTVSLSRAFEEEVTVRYATTDGSATAGSDYAPTSGTLTFAPGATSQTLSVLVNGDRLAEYTGVYSESFFVDLSDATNAFIAAPRGMAIIRDDEPGLTFTPNVVGAEGNTGSTDFIYTVTLSAAYDADVTIDYTTADLAPGEWYVSATAGVDYAERVGTLTIPAGQTSGAIAVPVFGDRVGEGDEVFVVKLTNSNSAHFEYAQAYGSIVDDEPYVSLSGGGAVVEGDSGTQSLIFTVTLSTPENPEAPTTSDADVTVSYTTIDYTALAGSDYQAATNVVTIPAGQFSQTFTVFTNGDTVAEDDESFSVNLTGATGGLIYNGWGSGVILDDDSVPTLSISDASVVEGNSGRRKLTFTIELSQPSDEKVKVSYATADGTATVADKDYVAKASTVTFPIGATKRTFSIDVRGDAKPEADEVFYVNLSSPVNAVIADGRARGMIKNDDAPKTTPTMRISDAEIVEGNRGTKLMLFRVRLSEASDEPVTVNFRTRNGTASYQNCDYAPIYGQLKFKPGERTKTIVVTIRGDKHVEGDEHFFVELSSASGAILADRRGRGVIRDNDG